MSTDDTHKELEANGYRFDKFVIDVRDRQLWRENTRIDLNARYFDALLLLVRERSRLVDKDRLFEEVWNDVVVSDSALTQCIKEIRKQLEDDASNPRFIQTVPRHGYRFIGEVETVSTSEMDLESHEVPRGAAVRESRAATGSDRMIDKSSIWQDGLLVLGAGTLGGGVAGIFVGMFYGFGLASADAAVGTISTLLVLVSLSSLVGLTGGFGVSLGLAGAAMAANYLPNLRSLLRIAGAAFGGLFVGTMAKLLGLDAFNLLFGRAPAGITGGPEGAVVGAALGIGVYLGVRFGNRFGIGTGKSTGEATPWNSVAGAGITVAIASALIPLAGGRSLGGSLDLLAKSFDESRLQLDTLGPLFGELHFGQATQVVLGGFEGLLFGSCVVGALAVISRLEFVKSILWKP